MTRNELHQIIDSYLDEVEGKTTATVTFERPTEDTEEVEEAVVEEKPKTDPDTRVVRSKGTGDKVYLLNDKEMTKRWITSPQVLEGLGFGMGDVGEIPDLELSKYKPVSAAFNA